MTKYVDFLVLKRSIPAYKRVINIKALLFTKMNLYCLGKMKKLLSILTIFNNKEAYS